MEYKTVFLGDSITAGYGVRREECWASGLPGRNWNKGINGDTTGGMLDRFSAHVLCLQPQRVVIMGGLNDLGEGNPWESAAKNIRKMCELARQQKIQPIPAVCVEPDYTELLGNEWGLFLPGLQALPAQLTQLNQWIREYAVQEQLLCLDFAAEFPKRITGEYCRYFSDGEHPNRFGHAVMHQIALETLYTDSEQMADKCR